MTNVGSCELLQRRISEGHTNVTAVAVWSTRTMVTDSRQKHVSKSTWLSCDAKAVSFCVRSQKGKKKSCTITCFQVAAASSFFRLAMRYRFMSWNRSEADVKEFSVFPGLSLRKGFIPLMTRHKRRKKEVTKNTWSKALVQGRALLSRLRRRILKWSARTNNVGTIHIERVELPVIMKVGIYTKSASPY